MRSTGISRGQSYAMLRRITESRAITVDFTRPNTDTGTLDETTETTSSYQLDMWFYRPVERTTQADAGERTLGDAQGMVVADEDYDPNTDEPPVLKDDRITNGGVDYEVLTVTGLPDEQSPKLWQVEFERRQQ